MTIFSKPSVRDAWADTADTNDISDPGNTYAAGGFVPVGMKPPRQYMNWILNWLSAAIRYFMQSGIPAFDAAESYPINAIVMQESNGLIYNGRVEGQTGVAPPTDGSVNSEWDSPWVPTPPVDDATVRVPNTAWVVSYAVKIGTPLSSQAGSVSSGQVPLAAVQQYQSFLEIAWGQITGYKNADLLEGYGGSVSVAGSTYVLRDGSGYSYHSYINASCGNNENSAVSQIMVTNGADNFLRKAGADWVLAQMMMTDAVTLQADPGGTPANGTPGTLVAYY